MDKKETKKNKKISMSKIKKVYLPIILTIIIVFNLPIFPNSIGFNTNFNFQPASGSGESYFFVDSHFSNNNNKKSNNSNNNRDINITIWVVFLILCIIFGIVYFIFNGINNDNGQDKQNANDKNDYIELLKDDSDFEGNI